MSTLENIHEDLPSTHQFEYSIGNNRFDNFPQYGSVNNFEEFIDVFEQVRAPEKGTFYITPAFENDGRRCNKNCKPHRYVASDLDGGSSGPLEDDEYAEISFQMSAWRGFRYETASSAQDNRRARYVLELDRCVTRDEGAEIRRVIRNLMPNFGLWDKSCDNPAQPLYMPGVETKIVRFGIEVLSVDAVLQLIPPKRSLGAFKKLDASKANSVLERLEAINSLQTELHAGVYRIVCPWGDSEHSDGRNEAYYFAPNESNNYSGGFHCFHSHCQERNIGHLINYLDHQEFHHEL